MEMINEYTTLSEEAIVELNQLAKHERLQVAKFVIEDLLDFAAYDYPEDFNLEIEQEIKGLDFNQKLGLVKALCHECQTTLVAEGVNPYLITYQPSEEP